MFAIANTAQEKTAKIILKYLLKVKCFFNSLLPPIRLLYEPILDNNKSPVYLYGKMMINYDWSL